MPTFSRSGALGGALALSLVWACSAGGDAPETAAAAGAAGTGGGATAAGTTSGATTGGEGGGFVGSATATTGSGPATTVASTGVGGGCAMPDPGPPAPEDACGDGLDNNLDGFVDEGCFCTPGQQQPCFGGPPTWLNEPNCSMGTQTCEGSGEFTGWGPCAGWVCGPAQPPEVCDNGVDDDCDQLVDEGCELNVNVDIEGDCIYVSCPPQAPYPVGCNIVMDGGDSRGCVASTPMSSQVYFQEGDQCPLGLPFEDAGHVSGSLTCSTVPGPGLNEQNCAINKANKFYPPDPSGCP